MINAAVSAASSEHEGETETVIYKMRSKGYLFTKLKIGNIFHHKWSNHEITRVYY